MISSIESSSTEISSLLLYVKEEEKEKEVERREEKKRRHGRAEKAEKLAGLRGSRVLESLKVALVMACSKVECTLLRGFSHHLLKEHHHEKDREQRSFIDLAQHHVFLSRMLDKWAFILAVAIGEMKKKSIVSARH